MRFFVFEGCPRSDAFTPLSGLAIVQHSRLEPAGQSRHEVHALMKNRHDQRRRTLAWQAKYVVLFKVGHSQCRKDCAHVRENALFQLGDIAAHLRIVPLLARVADDSAQIGFGLRP